MTLVLASGSPRRRELLAQAGYRFVVDIAGVDESLRAGEPPEDYVRRLAETKAAEVFARRIADAGTVVLGADTCVVLDGEILGKPRDAAEAERMLRRLSGRTHRVLTGIAVIRANATASRVERTEVVFRPIAETELAAYLASGDGLDKAGAYGIQGYCARWIPKIDGCYFNVMGLPIAAVVEMIGE